MTLISIFSLQTYNIYVIFVLYYILCVNNALKKYKHIYNLFFVYYNDRNECKNIFPIDQKCLYLVFIYIITGGLHLFLFPMSY